MKKAIIFLLFTIYIFSANAQSSAPNTNFNKLAWLEGKWTNIGVKAGRSGYERWIKVSDVEWQGVGVMMKGTDTVNVEKMKLIAKSNDIWYVADVPENKGAVYFKVTSITENGFVCENPEHDFPKIIRYQKDGNKLNATISGNGKSVDFHFEKKL